MLSTVYTPASLWTLVCKSVLGLGSLTREVDNLIGQNILIPVDDF